MDNLSEKAIRKNCPHCNLESHAFRYILEKTTNFYIICDAYPIIEGHILIIPKKHISCIGEYPDNLYKEFLVLNDKLKNFVKKTYNKVSIFEHGIFGQTVFHSHIHYLPFEGNPTEIVPEGTSKFTQLGNLNGLKNLFKKEGGYLYFSIANNLWKVDVSISQPRFFRDRFAKVLGRPERGNWKKMHIDRTLSQAAQKDAFRTKEKWKYFFKT